MRASHANRTSQTTRRQRRLPRVPGVFWLVVLMVLIHLMASKPASAGPSEKSLQLPAFGHLRSDLSADLTVVIGAQHAVRIRADAPVVKKISAVVQAGTLVITAAASFQSRHPIQIQITTPQLRSVQLDGAASLVLKRMHAERLDVRLQGSSAAELHGLNLKLLSSDIQDSSNVDVSGSVAEQEVKVTDAASYDAEELISDSATVRVNGSADAVMNVATHLTVDIADAGSVEYLGNPSLTQRVADAGSIEKR